MPFHGADLFKLDVDNKVKMTTKTKEGVLGGDPAKVVLALKNGAPKLSCKWKNDTVEVGTADYDYKKNSVNVETTFASIPSVPGLSVDVNMSKPLGGDKAAEFPIELTYESGDMLNAGLSCTACGRPSPLPRWLGCVLAARPSPPSHAALPD